MPHPPRPRSTRDHDVTDHRPELLTIPPDDIDPALVARAGAALRDGKLVAIPTETVYGLGCHARDEDAVQRVFAAKGRPSSDPLIVHVDGPQMLETVIAGSVPAVARELIDAFWPGPLTLVLPRAESIPDAITSGLDTVAVRCPAHPVAAAIITAAGVPVAAPSANRFSRISPTSAAHVIDELGESCDIVVDSGRTDRGLESTVLAVSNDSVVVLRHGALPAEAIQAACSVPVIDQDATVPGNASPGHDKRHYSPRSPAVAATPGAFDGIADEQTGSVVVAGFSDRHHDLPDAWEFFSLGLLGDLDAVGHDLYDNLRRLDAMDSEVLVLELTGQAGLGRAIDDRLTRAASSIVATTAHELTSALQAIAPTQAD